MKILIDRTGELLRFPANVKLSITAVLAGYGYHSINPLSIENFDEIEWDGIEFNRLFLSPYGVYRFNHWCGAYPYTEIEIEKIGTATFCE